MTDIDSSGDIINSNIHDSISDSKYLEVLRESKEKDSNEINNTIETSQMDKMLNNIALIHDTHDSIINEAIDIVGGDNENNNIVGDEVDEKLSPIELAHNAILERDKEAAFVEYKSILDEDENNIEAIYFMASYYKSYGNKEASLALFERIINLGVVNTSVYENIALLDENKSREYFSKALKIYNSIDTNYYHLNRILFITLDRYKNKDYLTAYNYCLLAVMISESIFLYNLMGCICYKLEYYDEALSSFYNAITKERKSNYVVLCNIAYSYKQKGSIKLAIYYFFKAIKLSDKHDAKLFFALGETYYISDNFKYAMYCFKKALELDSNYKEAIDMVNTIEKMNN